MELLAGAAAGAGAAMPVFDYNRENFMYDRELRRRKEFRLQKFRIAQAGLWREDVRDLVSLTQFKMHMYLIVNVLMLGFTVMLWCLGRLPQGTPDWLMVGFSISAAGAFVFLLLSIWLAMHAAVVAQSHETRLLTTMVRLPVPSWDEVNACRTFASEFETVEKKQMLRLPVAMGRQEGLATEAVPEPEEHVGRSRTGSDFEEPHAADSSRPADPWGLERRGDGLPELGCTRGSEVAKLRHIRLARHAAAHWQTYDAFARISMSMGVNQLLLALSYYLLGYILVEVGVRTAATYGVIVLVMLEECLMRLDLSLSGRQVRAFQTLIAFRPLISCLAAYHWSVQSDLGVKLAESLIVLAFVGNGAFIAVMTYFCRIREQDNGAMLPVAFHSVLYLDVFGWLTANDLKTSKSSPGLAEEPPVRLQQDEDIHAVCRTESRNSFFDDEPEYLPSANQRLTTDDSTYSAAQPGVCATSRARRPEDAVAGGSVHDMRKAVGAPKSFGPERMNAPNGKGSNTFFDADTYIPPASATEGEEFAEAFPEAVTGHGAEAPGILPWKVFRSAMLTLCAAWMLAAAFQFLDTTEIWSIDRMPGERPTWREVSYGGDHHPAGVAFSQLKHAQHTHFWDHAVVPVPSMLHLWMAGLSGGHLAADAPERIAIKWPYENFAPTSISCDAEGKRFAVADDLLVLSAELAGSTHSRLGHHFDSAGKALLQFHEVDCNGALVGEGLQDAAVTCSARSKDGSRNCDAIVLHSHGSKAVSCPLTRLSDQVVDGEAPKNVSASLASVAQISSSWLERAKSMHDREADDGAPASVVEMPLSIAVSPACGEEDGPASRPSCAFIATSQGRVVELKRSEGAKELVPVDIFHEGDNSERDVPFAWGEGAMRAFNSRFFGILHSHRQSIQVLDMKKGGLRAGRMMIPIQKPVAGFCAGGGYIYMVTQGAGAEVWRMHAPATLMPDKHAN